ncbi:MAG: CaiB/BaiF CoA-transferase family protein [Deltaproteobacteria bacterium]|nr:CaiB/BaiF CoA-transferase family protein [Deltaproteobacteria bacterium]
MKRKPLSGLKILDLTRLLPGWFAANLLSELGATILRVKPPVQKGSTLEKHFEGLFPSVTARTIDLKTKEGGKIFEKLVRRSDVILENFRPGVLRRLGFGYDRLKKIRPGIILCSITGYGQSGPMSQAPGHDLNYLALSGLLDLNRDSKGRPVIPGFQVADIAGGALTAVIQILAALRQKEGAHLDISMVKGAASLVARGHRKKKLPDFLRGSLARYNVYETKDKKHLAVACLEPKFWRNFCTAIRRPEWANGVESFQYIGRGRHEELKKILRSKNIQEWVQFFGEKEVCVTPVVRGSQE